MGKKRDNNLQVSLVTENGEVDITEKLAAHATNGNGKPVDEEPAKPRKLIEIRSATLNGIFCKHTYNLDMGNNMINRMKCEKPEVPVHKDLIAAFERLHPHLAVICEMVAATEILNIDAIEKYDPDTHDENGLEQKIDQFSVAGFRIEGEGDGEGVVLIGTRILSTGEPLKLETPKKQWEGEYAFINELRVSIGELTNEVEQYARGQKRADEAPTLFSQHQEPDYADIEN